VSVTIPEKNEFLVVQAAIEPETLLLFDEEGKFMNFG
jgi:hypothetical protein